MRSKPIVASFRRCTLKRNGFILACLVLAVVVCLPVSAAIAPDITIPVAGYLVLPNELTYRTELTLTNHRDAPQRVEIELIDGGSNSPLSEFTMQPRETKFLEHGGFNAGTSGRASKIGAMRFRAVIYEYSGLPELAIDPLGQLEVHAYIIAERGRFGSRGSSRQEMEGIPSSEYTAREAIFVGVRDEPPTYTNVGVTNLHPTQTETFYVEFKYLAPIAVVVPPLSSRMIRIPSPGYGGRSVRVYPEWSITDGEPARTTPWVAYASTVDGHTGDAFSGMRVPVTTTLDRY